MQTRFVTLYIIYIVSIDHHRCHVRRVYTEMCHVARICHTGIPLLWPVSTEYTLGPLIGSATYPPTISYVWVVRRE